MLLPDDRRGSAGQEAVELAELAGLHLDEWQAWVLEHALSEQSDGRWSAFEVVVIVPRQNGKGSILEARQLTGLFLLGERLQVHTAHEFKTCFEHFLRVVTLVESTPDLDRQVLRIRRGAGEQSIELHNGARLRFLARSGSSGRGLSGDVAYLDEAFDLTPAMMGALLPTLSARPNPQLWLTSSAPKADSLVLHRVRERGHTGTPGRLFFAEWGCERDADPRDPANWTASNPGLGIRIGDDTNTARQAIEAELEAMPLPEFLRERLGIPDDPEVDTDVEHRKFVAAWPLRAVAASESMLTGLPITVAIDTSPSGNTAIAVAGLDQRGERRVEVIDHRPGKGWVVARVVEIVTGARPKAHGVEPSPVMRITIDGASPANSLIPDINKALADADIDLTVDIASTRRLTQSCVGLWDGVVEGTVCHIAQVTLDQAVVAAKRRPVGDSWAWGRRATTEDISPLVSTSLALGAWAEHEATPVEDPVSAFVAFV